MPLATGVARLTPRCTIRPWGNGKDVLGLVDELGLQACILLCCVDVALTLMHASQDAIVTAPGESKTRYLWLDGRLQVMAQSLCA